VLGARQSSGYTYESFFCLNPSMKPIVGYARTATIRSHHAQTLPAEDIDALRDGYYQYVDHGGPRPSIAVIQDLDGRRNGFGCFWGEVNTNIHKGLGCLGVVTDGAARDVHVCPPDFQVLAARVVPSHAHVHLVDFGRRVNVSGMYVDSGDIVHADQHGAVVLPAHTVKALPEAARLYAKREQHIIDAARSPGFTATRLRQAQLEAKAIMS
jgi:regulator of RNase E activity RraA